MGIGIVETDAIIGGTYSVVGRVIEGNEVCSTGNGYVFDGISLSPTGCKAHFLKSTRFLVQIFIEIRSDFQNIIYMKLIRILETDETHSERMDYVLVPFRCSVHEVWCFRYSHFSAGGVI